MKLKLLPIMLLLVTSASFAQDVSDIYQPDVRRAGLKQTESLDVRRAMVGIGAVYQSQDNLQSRLGINLNLRWLAGERWYVLGEYQYAPFNEDEVSDGTEVLLQANETASVLAAGAGYVVMQGSASFNGRRTFPWQLAAEGFVGEQFTGDTSGRYTGIGFSWQIIEQDYWVAMGWRVYQSDDERLNGLDVNSGAQWGVSFGSWF